MIARVTYIFPYPYGSFWVILLGSCIYSEINNHKLTFFIHLVEVFQSLDGTKIDISGLEYDKIRLTVSIYTLLLYR